MLSTLLFFICAAVAVAGAFVAALTYRDRPRAQRALGVLAVGDGAAGMFALLSAGFAAVVELVAAAGSALLLGLTPAAPGLQRAGPGWSAQLAAAGCALLFAVLAFAAWRGGLASAAYPGGSLNTAAVARLLLDRDLLAGAAVGALLLVAVAGAATSWRARRR